MFRETLLETSHQERKNRSWSLTIAFMLEALLAAILIVIPLVSTGIIPVTTQTPIFAPLAPVHVEAHSAVNGGRGAPNSRSTPIVIVANSRNSICYLCKPAPSSSQDVNGSPNLNIPGEVDEMAGFHPVGNFDVPRSQPEKKRVVMSVIDPGQLIKRIDPVYPKLAGLTGVSGTVKLHAIISKEGAIESLSVISGHPMLVPAAMDAVSQWRYRPYLLNGKAVEVETFITVNFRRP